MAIRRFTHLTPRLVAICILTLAGSRRVDAQGSDFNSGVDMVPLTVTVTDAAGNYTAGRLTETDFEVFENGFRQTLTFFARARLPVAVSDGLYVALREFERDRRRHPETRRPVLVLLSDDLDYRSHITFGRELASQNQLGYVPRTRSGYLTVGASARFGGSTR